jgi:hypothetical protein
MSPVIEMLEWPSRSATALMWPCSSQPTAAECRRVWTPMSSTPAGRLRGDLDDAQQVARIDGATDLVGEHQPGVPPLIACAPLLGGLACFVLAQQRHRVWFHNDRR